MKKMTVSGISLATLVTLSMVVAACAPEETFRSTALPKDLSASPRPAAQPGTDLNHPGAASPSGTPSISPEVPAGISSIPGNSPHSLPVPEAQPLPSQVENPMPPSAPQVPTASVPAPAPVPAPAQPDGIASIPGSVPHPVPVPGSEPLPEHVENPTPPRVIVKETELEIKDEVLFVFDRADLTHYAEILLDEVARSIRSEKGKFKQILIWGHTDGVGSADYNLRLSMDRAKAVYRYLVEVRHLDPRLMSYEGFGATRLKDPANPESEVNRRVEFKIIR